MPEVRKVRPKLYAVRPPIVVVNQARVGLPGKDGDADCVQDQLGPKVIGHPTTFREQASMSTARYRILFQVRRLRDVGDPQLVRLRGDELPLDQVRGRTR